MAPVVPSPPASIAALTVLYRNPIEAMSRTVEAFDNAARIGREAGLISEVTLAFGDASPTPILADDALARLKEGAQHVTVSYEFFSENTGTSRGQNRLARTTTSDLVLLCNPDVLPEGRALTRMVEVLRDRRVGLVEAKQLPVEHPKDCDPTSGETSWGSGAFSMVPRAAFDEVGGFDEGTFFLYCDDVDLSWRLREAGYRIIHQPAAAVFHDKDLSARGGWIPTEAERYYSAEAALLLAHKWSRDDILAGVLHSLESSNDDNHRRAVAEFERRRDAGNLAARRDPEHVVGRFVEGNYAPHRFAL